jgi:tRNA1(Val) A37 N6-methylase TrmN6
MNAQFIDASIKITNALDKKTKKDNGIFFTPKSIRTVLLERVIHWIKTLKIKIKLIVEPSCGSGEFLLDIDKLFKNKVVIGIELNTTIYNEINKTINDNIVNNKLTILNEDFMMYNIEGVNLNIGNPPFVVLTNKSINEKYKEYTSYISGRPNLYCLFLIKCLQNLDPKGGIVSFILPKSILNSSYYNNVRKYIYESFTLLEIVDFTDYKDYIETDQGTIGIIITNKKNCSIEKSYTMNIKNNIIFCIDTLGMESLIKGSTNLRELGLLVKTGPIVWNQHKEILTNDYTKPMLIYNSNVTNGKLCVKTFDNKEKKQYIDIDNDKIEKPPFIVVNRGNGNSKYILNGTIINEHNVTIENHLNIIYNVSNQDPMILEKIIKSFNDKRSQQFIEMYCGNNSLSKTELETIFPIYID